MHFSFLVQRIYLSFVSPHSTYVPQELVVEKQHWHVFCSRCWGFLEVPGLPGGARRWMFDLVWFHRTFSELLWLDNSRYVRDHSTSAKKPQTDLANELSGLCLTLVWKSRLKRRDVLFLPHFQTLLHKLATASSHTRKRHPNFIYIS